MYISGIYLAGFGKYTDRHFDFSNGINILYGDNEKGKSTIHRFIEAMLYDLNAYQFGLDFEKYRYEKYLPWGNKEVFSGEMQFIDGDKTYRVERDFHKEKGIKVYMGEQRIGPYRQTPGNEIIKNHEHKMMRVLGITDISAKKGTGMLDDVQERIMNIKATNSGTISLKDSIEKVEGDIERLERDLTYQSLKQSYKLFSDTMRDIDIKQSSHKEVTIEYLDNLNKADAVQAEIDELNDRLTELQVVDQLKKSKRLHKINAELEVVEAELDELRPYESIQVSDMESILRNRENEKSMRNGLDEVEARISRLSNELEARKNDFSEDELAYLSDASNIDKARIKIENLGLLEQQLATFEENADQLRNEMISVQPDYRDDEDFAAEEKMIDEQYQRFLNTSSWKHRIEEEIEATNSVIGLEEKLIDTESKLMNFKILSLVLQISGALLVLAMFAKPTWAFAIFFIILAFGITIIILYFVRKNLDKEHIGLEFQLKNIHDEVRKNNSRLSKATEQLDDIIERFGVNTESEFVALYEEKKSDLRKRIDIRSNINNSRARQGTVVEKINFKLSELNEELSSLNQSITSADQALEILEIRLKDYREFKVKEEEEDEYLRSKEQMRAKLSSVEQSLATADLISTIESMEQYQALRDRLTKNQELHKKLTKDRDELMEDSGFSPLDQSETDAVTISDFNEMERELELIRNQKAEKVTYKEDLVIRCRRLMAESEHYERLHEPYSITKKSFEEVAGKLNDVEQHIDLHKKALDILLSSTDRIRSRFTHALENRLYEILHQVIGDRYEVSFDEMIHLQVRDVTTQEKVDINNLSQGTIDQIYFALRIGLIDALQDNINIPLILDDSFVHYDGGRLVQMLEQLARLSRQIIILTCHHREKRVFDELGVEYNYIEL